jgi:molecular chaperone Hsp33
MAAVGGAHDSLKIPPDDVVISFRTVTSGISGRLVRLGSVSDTILSRHGLPEPVSVELGEALSLAALLGSALPGDGRITVQAQTDGAVTFLAADFDAPGHLRGYARFDKVKLAAAAAATGTGTRQGIAGVTPMLGQGHMAITLDQGGPSDRYQGVVALDGGILAEGAMAYFENSEALPAFVRLSVARHFEASRAPQGLPAWGWRSGGIMLQHTSGTGSDENWVRVRTLAETIEDHELLDPGLTPERLLLRLFHEEGVVVLKVSPLSARCRCSREKVFDVLKNFGSSDHQDMLDDNGRITATCEFCTTPYTFEPSELSTAASGKG